MLGLCVHLFIEFLQLSWMRPDKLEIFKYFFPILLTIKNYDVDIFSSDSDLRGDR